ncbi:MAG TPA: phosphotransferase [Dokdonella sp.]
MTKTSDRAAALERFVAAHSDDARFELAPASSDASSRSYWRVRGADGRTRIVMDAPSDRGELDAWLAIGARLREAGLHAPEVFGVDRERGFVLMEDLGARTYLQALDDASADALYADALEALLRAQQRVAPHALPAFDDAFVRTELELLPEWFLRRHLGVEPTPDERATLDRAFAALAAALREQPQRFMHRDYHSRNLMIGARGAETGAAPMLANPGIVDFQGAVRGPLAYDLASLLRDCYVAWPPERVAAWAERYRRRLLEAGLVGTEVDTARFRRWFDLAGLQRHLKVLGIFCRLRYRDGKPQYLADLPRVWHYALAVAREHAPFHALADLLERARAGRDLARPRDEPA